MTHIFGVRSSALGLAMQWSPGFFFLFAISSYLGGRRLLLVHCPIVTLASFLSFSGRGDWSDSRVHIYSTSNSLEQVSHTAFDFLCSPLAIKCRADKAETGWPLLRYPRKRIYLLINLIKRIAEAENLWANHHKRKIQLSDWRRKEAQGRMLQWVRLKHP